MKVVPVKGKGDVRIPVEMRRALGIQEGDDILVEIEDDHLVLRRIVATRDTASLLGALRSGQDARRPHGTQPEPSASVPDECLPGGDADA